MSLASVIASSDCEIHLRTLLRSFSFGSSLVAWLRPSFEKALVLNSFSQTLNRSISVSISFRASVSGRLSLMSELVIHVLMSSRYRCSFLICDLSSASNFSFWLAFWAL